VSSITHDGSVFHELEMLTTDNIDVTCGRDEDITDFGCTFHIHNIKPIHARLESPQWIDFGYDHMC